MSPQLIENKACKNALYSRAPKVEVYENKGQSAILLAPQTRVFRIFAHRRLALLRALQLLGIAFTTAVGILIQSSEKGLLQGPDALAKLAMLAKYGRYKNSIIEDARRELEVKP